jgi:hypothetical protein
MGITSEEIIPHKTGISKPQLFSENSIALDDDSRKLAIEYVERGIFPEKQLPNANHVAIAVVNDIDYLIIGISSIW